METKRIRINVSEMGTSSSEKESAVEIDITYLPEELLIGIFSYLTLSDRKNARLVCKYWHKLSYDFSLIQHDVTVLHKNINLIQNPSPCSQHVNLSLKIGHLENNSLFSTSMVNSEWFWENHCQNLRSLNIDIFDNDYLYVLEIFRFFPLLEHVTVTEADFSNGRWMLHSFSDKVQFLNLKSLTVFGSSEFTTGMLKVALKKAPKLVSLFIMAFERFHFSEKAKTSWNLDFIPTAKIKEIIFSGDRINDFISGMADIFCAELEKLTLFNLKNEGLLSCKPLGSIIRRCVNLKHLVLECIPCPNYSPLIPIMGLNSLTTISLGYSRELTDDMIASLAVLNNLSHFDLIFSPKLTTRGICEVFGRRVRPKMVELRLEDVPFLSNVDIMVELTPKLPNLKVLYLGDCKITRNSLESLITHNPFLQCLILTGKYNKRQPYGPLSINRMNQLIHLDLYHTNIPKKIIKNLEVPSLEILSCKYKYCKPKGVRRSLKVEKNCMFIRSPFSKKKGYITCCKSPFGNIVTETELC